MKLSVRSWVFTIISIMIIGSCIFLLLSHSRNVSGKTAVISVDGQEIYRTDLDSVKEPYAVQAGAHNKVWIEPGQISMTQADCPDQICVNTGKISKPGVPIVCLPNKVIIRIEE